MMSENDCMLAEEPAIINRIRNINLVQLLGRLEKDPEFISHHRGKMARLTMITSELIKNEYGEKACNIQRHILTAWDEQAELAATILMKGQLIYTEGRLVHNSFRDKQGCTRVITEVKVRVIKVLA
jgi:single stranded DNA-binding protein